MGAELGWVVFAVLVVVMLSLDLVVFHRKAHVESIREAAWWSVFWIALGLGFGAWVWWSRGAASGTEYFAAYLLEKSLSVDNLFVMSVIFTYFRTPQEHQHRVLFWGILGALVTRGLFIGLGIEVLHRFEWMTWLLGAFLVYTAIKLFLPEGEGDEPGQNFVVRFARRYLRFTDRLDGDRFVTRVDGRLLFTPLFFALLVVESTDVVFAVDSIPAVLGLTTDPFVVYTSNVFAILGLRALYFVLAGAVLRFHYMKHGLSVILGYVGIKMLAEAIIEVPTWVSLVVIIGVLTLTAVASAIRERRVGIRIDAWQEAHGATDLPAPPRVAQNLGDVERLVYLHQLPAFRAASLDDLRPLAPATFERVYRAGETIFLQGDDGDALYIVMEGEIRIEHSVAGGPPVPIDTLRPSQYFGEMALFCGGPRSASAIAQTDAKLLAVARDPFLEAGTRTPKILVEVIRVLSERLRDADEELVRMREAAASAGVKQADTTARL